MPISQASQIVHNMETQKKYLQYDQKKVREQILKIKNLKVDLQYAESYLPELESKLMKSQYALNSAIEIYKNAGTDWLIIQAVDQEPKESNASTVE